jgi:hypothetical protein
VSKVFEEGRLRFEFDDSWFVVKYDNHPDYRKIERLDGTKAVDFIAINRDSVLFLIEVKDIRGHRIENRDRLRTAELAIEVGQKVRDTLAGIVGAHHRGKREAWERVVVRLTSQEPSVRVLLWLEQDLPSKPTGRRSNEFSLLINALKGRLDWLTSKVLVASQSVGSAPEGMKVTNLPGAGRRT